MFNFLIPMVIMLQQTCSPAIWWFRPDLISPPRRRRVWRRWLTRRWL